MVNMQPPPRRGFASADGATAVLHRHHLVELRDGDTVEPHVARSADLLLPHITVGGVAGRRSSRDLRGVLLRPHALVMLLTLAVGFTPRAHLLSAGPHHFTSPKTRITQYASAEMTNWDANHLRQNSTYLASLKVTRGPSKAMWKFPTLPSRCFARINFVSGLFKSGR